MAQITNLRQRGADCVELTTNHSLFDVEYIQNQAILIVDTRNMLKEVGEKVYKL